MHVFIYAYTYMYVTRINEKVTEFESEQGRIHGRACREERVRGNDAIIF